MPAFWPRLNTLLLLVLTLMAASIIAMLASRAFGGPLDPPGAPTSSDGVRGPGTPIDHLPFPITQPGYYYVTRNLSGGASQDGITIASSNVTVDLGGFTLAGGTTPGVGISASGPRNIVVKNGAVRGWYQGILLTTTYSRVEHVAAISNSYAGINLTGESVVSDCIASISQNGIIVDGSTVRNCTVAENQTGISVNNDSLVEGSRVSLNTSSGVNIIGTRNKITNNQLAGNPVADLYISGNSSTYNVITGNVICSTLGTNPNNTYADDYC